MIRVERQPNHAPNVGGSLSILIVDLIAVGHHHHLAHNIPIMNGKNDGEPETLIEKTNEAK